MSAETMQFKTELKQLLLAVARIAGKIQITTDAAWWVFAAVAVVIAIDVSRTVVSLRAARRYGSPALSSNALHFGSDLAGTLAVLAGLVAVRLGWPEGDSIAALFVALLVLSAASRLIRRNVDVLMDRAPSDAVLAARQAIAALVPPVELRRLRLRQAAGRTFTDVVIGVSPGDAVGQGHAVADRVLRDALQVQVQRRVDVDRLRGRGRQTRILFRERLAQLGHRIAVELQALLDDHPADTLGKCRDLRRSVGVDRPVEHQHREAGTPAGGVAATRKLAQVDNVHVILSGLTEFSRMTSLTVSPGPVLGSAGWRRRRSPQ
jgi:hypothetical protein